MPFVRAGQIARPTPVLMADTPLGLVGENLRVAGCGTLPVLDRLVTGGGEDGPGGPQWQMMARQARVIGVVEERDLSAAVLPVLQSVHESAHAPRELPVGGNGAFMWNGAPLPEDETEAQNEDSPRYAPLSDLTQATARDVMRSDFGIVPALFSLENALITLDRYNAAALPVIDPDGGFRGMISRADIVAALGRNVRPPVIGGMATPLGVWLTTGALTGGAPPLGLFLSGVTLALCWAVAYLVVLLPLALLNPEWAAMFASGRLSAMVGDVWFDWGTSAVQGLAFLLLMRALPLSGIHAAEHQTVWAIERGLPLTVENVRRMPRAHPRCGTNLMVLMGLIMIVFQHLPSFDPSTVLLSQLFIYLTWRNFGELLQNYFTTRPATDKQIESGIRAGREVLEKYQQQPHIMPSFGERLFRSGMLYAAAGAMLVSYAFMAFSSWIALRLLGIG